MKYPPRFTTDRAAWRVDPKDRSEGQPCGTCSCCVLLLADEVVLGVCRVCRADPDGSKA